MTIPLGRTSINISRIGYGAMGLTSFYSSDNGTDASNVGAPYVLDEEGIKRGDAAISTALEAGVNFFDTAEIYGAGGNEQLLALSIKKHGREKFVVATKFMAVRDEKLNFVGISGSEENVLTTAERCLKNLGIDTIDLYYAHRIDPATPIEVTTAAMAKLVASGKVRAIGLSEAPAHIIRRAHAVHPISAVQVEYSLGFREIERNGVLATCRELGITLVAYSPVCRGLLTGKFKSGADLAETDWRRTNPRFQGENLDKNLSAGQIVAEVAAKHGATASQVCIAWLLNQGADIVPIPGSCRPQHIKENSEAGKLKLDAADLARLDTVEALFAGNRYDDRSMALCMDSEVLKSL